VYLTSRPPTCPALHPVASCANKTWTIGDPEPNGDKSQLQNVINSALSSALLKRPFQTFPNESLGH
jgi:hypothetical protein